MMTEAPSISSLNDGYPDEETLQAIRQWDVCDPLGLILAIKGIWHYPDFVTRKGWTFRFATGGWSGNEELINAFHDNAVAWMLCWEMSRRGGLFAFKIPKNFRQSPSSSAGGSQ